MLLLLRQMAERGQAWPLILGGMPQGLHNWTLDSVSESWDVVYGGGELAAATVKLTLTEYVPTL